jgi:hypothetical protein
LFDGRLACLDGGLGRAERLCVAIKLALGNGVSFRFGNVTLHVQRGVSHLRFRLGQLPFGLIKYRLERTGVDLKQQLPLSQRS